MSEKSRYICPICGDHFDCPVSSSTLPSGAKLIRCPCCAHKFELLPDGGHMMSRVDRKEAL